MLTMVAAMAMSVLMGSYTVETYNPTKPYDIGYEAKVTHYKTCYGIEYYQKRELYWAGKEYSYWTDDEYPIWFTDKAYEGYFEEF